ncbi:MAG: 3-hydroxyacyl-ACP dehydratase FabZ [Candidatus Dadabacteria bacterium]|nr:3-hydroxyacyl-ACP dehydratase FabZ [Candidatus Dadabacteria bacterium]
MIMDIDDIKEYIPHREPFLFVDSVVKIEPGKSIVARRLFRAEEDFFRGHFPSNPVVPGVIIVEAMAQVGGILVCKSNPEELRDKGPALVGIDKVRFRKPVSPGDEVEFEVQILRSRAKMWILQGIARVEKEKVATANIMASVF